MTQDKLTQYKEERAKARNQWLLEQSYEMNASVILQSQLHDFLGQFTTDHELFQTLKKIYLTPKQGTQVTYTTDAKGRPAWCIKTRQKKGFSEDYLHYDQDKGLYVWSSNEGEPIKVLDTITRSWTDSYKTAAYQAYAIKELLYWGITCEVLNSL